ncbi:hypothetical protein ACLB2K_011467 [Fragaria x ananassa]
MSTIFYAVQCCQCSTMQVKQRKQSSKNNKWTCVVCNQKQSARKVFAESTMARDLRPFVQSSNMSRQFTQNQQQHHEHALVSDVHECHTKRKDELIGPSGGFEPKVVTELPPELFKRPKMNKCNDASGSGGKENGGVYELQNCRPVISKRNTNKHVLSPADVEDWNCKLTMNKNTSHWSHLKMQENNESRSLQAKNVTLTGASKWNDYVTKDDNDGLRIINNKSRADNTEQWSNQTIANYEYETLTTDERVEDDIHPDFLQG